MNLHPYFSSIFALAVIACQQQDTKPRVQPSEATTSSEAPRAAMAPPAVTTAASTPVLTPHSEVMTLVRTLAHNSPILTKSWNQMSVLFPGCTKPVDSNDLSCPPMDGLKLISIQDGGLGIIDLEFSSPVTCDSLYQAVQAELGKGEVGIDKCDVRWKLSPDVKGGYATISNDPKAPERIFFQLAIEQGP